jgi:glycosyltransferase involved in cell wall biosynthesis
MHHSQNITSPFSKYFVSNVDFDAGKSFAKKLKFATKILYSIEAKRKLETLLNDEKPGIAHLHKIPHQISPSIIHILRKRNIPIVMTLHDYKMVCASYRLLTNGKVCEQCSEGKYYWCFINRCAKNSYIKSALNVMEMYLHHKLLHMYDLVDVFISPSKFLKRKMEEMGFKKRIEYLPNFVNTDEYVPAFDYKEKAIYYAGRLSDEKGLSALIEAAKGVDVKLRIMGDGPLREELEKRKGDKTYFTGHLPRQKLKNLARQSMAMVIPSEWCENNPRSLIEAFALGKPVIGARIGGIPELIKDGETGLTFESGSVPDLKRKLNRLVSMSKREIRDMGKAARRLVEEEFSAEKHYEKLTEKYRQAKEHYFR